MNNKQIGTEFEQKVVNYFTLKGFWVHFLSPNNRGAQPFDVIAVKNGVAIAGDCKTSAKKTFSINRLEDNQILAFEKWISCGNSDPYIFIGYKEDIFCVEYSILKQKRSIKIYDFPRLK